MNHSPRHQDEEEYVRTPFTPRNDFEHYAQLPANNNNNNKDHSRHLAALPQQPLMNFSIDNLAAAHDLHPHPSKSQNNINNNYRNINNNNNGFHKNANLAENAAENPENPLLHILFESNGGKSTVASPFFTPSNSLLNTKSSVANNNNHNHSNNSNVAFHYHHLLHNNSNNNNHPPDSTNLPHPFSHPSSYPSSHINNNHDFSQSHLLHNVNNQSDSHVASDRLPSTTASPSMHSHNNNNNNNQNSKNISTGRGEGRVQAVHSDVVADAKNDRRSNPLRTPVSSALTSPRPNMSMLLESITIDHQLKMLEKKHNLE
eukprot:GDKK01050115.1.p1 GENE.GDKK01050115.1~~GDKK01050115.1.p1  ORF type:complete len:316 (+),score=116.26 GDKK01050115.1:96-1043(+)